MAASSTWSRSQSRRGSRSRRLSSRPVARQLFKESAREELITFLGKQTKQGIIQEFPVARIKWRAPEIINANPFTNMDRDIYQQRLARLARDILGDEQALQRYNLQGNLDAEANFDLIEILLRLLDDATIMENLQQEIIDQSEWARQRVAERIPVDAGPEEIEEMIITESPDQITKLDLQTGTLTHQELTEALLAVIDDPYQYLLEKGILNKSFLQLRDFYIYNLPVIMMITNIVIHLYYGEQAIEETESFFEGMTIIPMLTNRAISLIEERPLDHPVNFLEHVLRCNNNECYLEYFHKQDVLKVIDQKKLSLLPGEAIVQLARRLPVTRHDKLKLYSIREWIYVDPNMEGVITRGRVATVSEHQVFFEQKLAARDYQIVSGDYQGVLNYRNERELFSTTKLDENKIELEELDQDNEYAISVQQQYIPDSLFLDKLLKSVPKWGLIPERRYQTEELVKSLLLASDQQFQLKQKFTFFLVPGTLNWMKQIITRPVNQQVEQLDKLDLVFDAPVSMTYFSDRQEIIINQKFYPTLLDLPDH